VLSKFGINNIENLSHEEIKKKIEESYDKKYNFTKDEIEKIKDTDALELIQNLLSLNPKNRFNALQVLQSKYLNSNFKDIDSLNVKIEKIKIQDFKYELIDNNKFSDIIVDLKSKLSGS
jgi:serine/threonine protein kinase